MTDEETKSLYINVSILCQHSPPKIDKEYCTFCTRHKQFYRQSGFHRIGRRRCVSQKQNQKEVLDQCCETLKKKAETIDAKIPLSWRSAWAIIFKQKTWSEPVYVCVRESAAEQAFLSKTGPLSSLFHQDLATRKPGNPPRNAVNVWTGSPGIKGMIELAWLNWTRRIVAKLWMLLIWDSK